MATGIFSHRDFRHLFIGTTVSGLGSWLLVVAVPVTVFKLTGSATATGLTLAIEALPAIVIGPWAGALVDQWHHKTTMITTDLVSAAGVALILAGSTAARVPWIYAGLICENVALTGYRPASRAIVPNLLGTGTELAAANSVSAFVAGTMRLVGPPLGTLLLSVAGLRGVVGLDVASYLASAALTATITAPRTHPPPTAGGVGQVAGQLRDGWRTLTGTPLLRGLLISTSAFWTANAGLTALLVPFVVRRLASPGADVGFLISGLGVGYLIGAAFARRVIVGYPARTVIVTSYAGVGVAFLVLFNAPNILVAVIAAALAGIPGGLAQIVTQHQVQATTPQPVLGRATAVFYASDAAAAVIGALLAPTIVAATNLGAALNIFSTAVIATAAAAAVAIPKTPRGS